jgi:protease secretion system membrane fusion protein
MSEAITPENVDPPPAAKGLWSRFVQFEQRLGGWIDGWNPYHPENLEGKGLKPVAIEESEIRRNAAKWFLGFFALFLAWAFLAPIDAGVTVPGTVSVLGNRKQVQHPSGGVVQEILVKEGAVVNEGDILVRINPLRTQSDLTSLELQYINQLATESRLRAERDGSPSIKWMDELSKRFKPDDVHVIEAKNLQIQLFNSRRAEFNSQVSSLNEQITGLTAMMQARRTQQRSLKEEMINITKLSNDGFVPKSQANQAERQNSDIESSVASTQADIARAKLQISQMRSAFLKEVDNNLQEMQKNRDASLTKLESAKFDRDLAEVKAPVSGSVVGLKVFTVGGVISGGAVLMEVVPKDETLIIQAKIPPNVIDKVQVGMVADMRFTSFNADTTPVVIGTVKSVGADKEPGGDKEGEYYAGQIETSKEGLQKLAGLKIQPGMPVDVIIKTGERTFMSLLLKPLTDKLSTAFK